MMDVFVRSRKIKSMADAEAAGNVADSMEVRKAIVARMKAGEITLEQAQAELKRIQRDASAAGKTTRARAFREG